jgi:hypothetical protein
MDEEINKVKENLMHVEVRPLWDTRGYLAFENENYRKPLVDK